MFEPTLISPMLDNFAMGRAISEHDGVHCYPAMDNEANGKYIVKVISVPASQTQLDALLLSGAYSSKDAALAYFKELSDGIITEAQILEKLSNLEGFLPFKDYQCVPMDGLCGYNIYLLSPYKRTLSKQFIKHPLTHLDAINMGLDLCAALAVCRRAGFLYVALKPNNVYITESKGYRIGDLGFIRMDSLKYASLPDKYHSQYTPPEIKDAFSSLNTTLDVYALGLILYQAYNNGTLPFDTSYPPEEAFAAPAYADYEMSEIILKACAPNPDDRWQDPMDMGQALVGYMQRNGANDTPIVPPLASLEPEIESPPEVEAEDSAQDHADSQEEAVSQAEDETGSNEKVEAETMPETSAPVHSEDEAADESDAPEDCSRQESVNPEVDAIIADTKAAIGEVDEAADSETVSEPFESDGSSEDETVPGDDDVDVKYDDVTDEVSEILTQADDLASHPVPEPAVAPEPIDVPIPEPVLPDMPEEDSENTNISDDQTESDTEIEEQSEESSHEDSDGQNAPVKKKGWLKYLSICAAVAALIAGGLYLYKNIYLIPIKSIRMEGSEDSLTVYVDADIDDSKLKVICADTYGTKISASVADGAAVFTGLVPDTGYTVNVEVNGFHKLSGQSSGAYSTPERSEIVQFSAVSGSEDGSVILGFTVEGPDSAQWKVTYSADGEEPVSVTFPSHMATLTGLTVGKEYTFTLEPEDKLYVTGSTEIKYVAKNLVYAEDLAITSYENDTLTASWYAPEGSDVESWTVRCYSADIYNETIVTSETSAVFENLPENADYTVEVTAAGMSVAQRTYVTENAITFRNVQTELASSGDLVITWETDAVIPEGGWVIGYTINESTQQETVTCTENKAVFSPAIPGARYIFNVQNADGNMVLGFPSEYQMPEVSEFHSNYQDHELFAEDLNFRMCKRPKRRSWNRNYVKESDYGNTYSVGQEIAFVVKIDKKYGVSDDNIVMLYVISDKDGGIISADTHEDSWRHMWNDGYCELNIPGIPQQAGEYTIQVYFNGALATQQDFTITQ